MRVCAREENTGGFHTFSSVALIQRAHKTPVLLLMPRAALRDELNADLISKHFDYFHLVSMICICSIFRGFYVISSEMIIIISFEERPHCFIITRLYCIRMTIGYAMMLKLERPHQGFIF